MDVVLVFRKKHAVAALRTRRDQDQPPGTKAHNTKVVHKIAGGKSVYRQTNAKQAYT